MRVIGVVVEPGQRPVVRCVVLEGNQADPQMVESFDLKTPKAPLPDEIYGFANAMSSRMTDLNPDRVVIRMADTTRVATRRSGSEIRLIIEGALSYVCHAPAKAVILRRGKEVQSALKDASIDADAEGKRIDPTRAQAAAAALSGLEP